MTKKPKDNSWIDEKWFEGRPPRGPENQRHGWIRGRLADLGHDAKDICIIWGRLEGKKALDDAVASNFINKGTPVITLDRAIVLAELLRMGLLELTVRLAEKPLPDVVLGPLPPNMGKGK